MGRANSARRPDRGIDLTELLVSFADGGLATEDGEDRLHRVVVDGGLDDRLSTDLLHRAVDGVGAHVFLADVAHGAGKLQHVEG